MTGEHRQSPAHTCAFKAILAARLKASPSSGRWGWLVVALLVCFTVAGISGTALAQGTPPESRMAVDLGGGYQTSTASFSQTVGFELYSEQGSLTSSYTIGRQPVADAGVTLRVWRTFGIGLAESFLHDSGSAQVTALLPNPFVFGQPRQINGSAAVSHTEAATHLQATYWAQLSQRLEVVVAGGPSFFRVDQDFVSDVTYTETYPDDTATYQGASVVRQRKTVTGGNISGEIGWRLARHLGLAGALRFSRATAQFPGTSAQAVVVGSLQVGGGVRLLF